jgi:GDSL-like lipase/acylhydrolase family protein
MEARFAKVPASRSIAQRALLMLGGLLLGGLSLEAGLRLYGLVDPDTRTFLQRLTDWNYGIEFRWTSHPFLPYVGTPNMEYVVRRDDAPEGVHGKNNSAGFRTHEFPEHKGPNDYYVLCLGGSTTWGAISTSNETTWPGLLEQRLAARYPERNVQVFNLGASAATCVYSIVSLALMGVHLQPDLVIVYQGVTDLEPIYAKHYRTDQSHYFKDFDPDTAWVGYRRSLPAWLRRSYVMAYVTARLDDALDVNSLMFYVTHRVTDQTDDGALAIRRMLADMKTIDSIATGNGSKALFSTFQFYDPTGSRMNADLRQFFAENGLDYVDQDALIPDFDRSINIDDCHFTRKGDELMAENYFQYIVAHHLIDEQPGT